jgi:hypothetical protein
MVTSYSARGMVEGFLVDNTSDVNYGLICTGWLCWALAAKTRNWSVKVIIIKDKVWLPELKAWCSDACI